MWMHGYVHRVPRILRGFQRSNVHPAERWLSALVGLGVSAIGLRRWKGQGLAMLTAGMLLRRALTGRCPLYRRFGWSST